MFHCILSSFSCMGKSVHCPRESVNRYMYILNSAEFGDVCDVRLPRFAAFQPSMVDSVPSDGSAERWHWGHVATIALA